MQQPQALANAFSISQMVYLGNIEGVSHDDSLFQPEKAGNCINWIAGHILAARGGLLQLLGEQPFLSDEEKVPYGRGSAGVKPGDTCCSLGRINEGMQSTGPIIVAKLTETPVEKYSEKLDPSAFPVPVEHPSVGTLISILLFHEGYHNGQIGLIRRALGKLPAIP